MCFRRRKAIATITENAVDLPLLDTFAQFHQLIIWEIASHLPLTELQNLLKVAKQHKRLKDILMLVINPRINPIIDEMNLKGTNYCLTRCRLSRPLVKKEEIDFIRTELCSHFATYDKTCYSDAKIIHMLDYIDNEPTKEEQIRATLVLLSIYYVAIDRSGNPLLPKLYLW